jgi:hypothetical protein
MEHCRQGLPAYRRQARALIRKPASREEIKTAVLNIQRAYYNAVFRAVMGGFPNEVRSRVSNALKDPVYLGLPADRTPSYHEERGVSAGEIFAAVSFALEGGLNGPAPDPDVMTRLDETQWALMDGVWKDLLKGPEKKDGKAAYMDRLEKAFRSISKPGKEAVFPGGFEESVRVAEALAYILNVDLNACRPDDVGKLLDIFITADPRITGSVLNDLRLRDELKLRYRTLIRTNDLSAGVLAYCGLHRKDRSYSLRTPEEKARWEAAAAALKTDFDIIKRNTIRAYKIQPDNDLGRIATKPLYTSGRESAAEYVNHLASDDSRRLRWVLSGETSAIGILGKEEIYSAFTLDGAYYGVLYINPNSEFPLDYAPSGYRYMADPSVYVDPGR